MDFFQAQERSRRRTSRLILLYFAAIAGIASALYLALVLILRWVLSEGQNGQGELSQLPLWDPSLFAKVAAGAVLLIAMGTVMKLIALRHGGRAVAESLGGVKVAPNSADPSHRRLINVVEEIAISSGVRVPEIYLLKEPGINAFAAGYSPDDAAIAVTQGCLDALDRDQLQGVVAHEFSHVLNGDMRLNIRLISLLAGIFVLITIGRLVLQFGGSSSSRSKKKGGGLPILLFALAMLLIGAIGYLFGRLIQAAISRQREYLADASAVQFTRNPEGISGALIAIGRLGSTLSSPHSSAAAHLLISQAKLEAGAEGESTSLFATHPPLRARIKAIDPSFDGDFSVRPARAVKRDAPRRSAPSAPAYSTYSGPRVGPEQLAGGAPATPGLFVAAIASLEPPDPAKARERMARLAPELIEMAHDPARASGLYLALIAAAEQSEGAAGNVQGAVGAELTELESKALERASTLLATTPSELWLEVAELSLMALRANDARPPEAFLALLQRAIDGDGAVTIVELALAHIARRHLEPPVRSTKKLDQVERVEREVELLLSAMAHAEGGSQEERARAFALGAEQIGTMKTRLTLRDASELTPAALGAAFRALDETSYGLRRLLIASLAAVAGADGHLGAKELELLRATCAALGCPAPPSEALQR